MKKETLLLLFGMFFGVYGCLKDVPPRPPKNLDESVRLNEEACNNAFYEDWETSAYVLPYPVGESYTVNLSHCGGSYHSGGLPDQYAIDFGMNVGTIITASRSGRVVFVEESGFDGSFPNNLVVVQHDDGTFAQYMHLTYEGARVNVGKNIDQGDVIGRSGHTGLAGYPHLHFVVTKPGSWKFPYVSFPTTFSNTDSNPRSLEEGKMYRAQSY